MIINDVLVVFNESSLFSRLFREGACAPTWQPHDLPGLARPLRHALNLLEERPLTESLYDDGKRLIGHYEMLAGFLNGAGIGLEADTEAERQAFYWRVAA